MSVLLKQWEYFAKSFKERRILTMLFYEGLFYIALFLIVILLYSFMADLSAQARDIVPIGADFEIKTPADELNFISAVKLQTQYVLSATVAFLLIGLAFISSRFYIYSNVLDRRKNWRFYGKNMLVAILTALAAFTITYLFQLLVFAIFAKSLLTSRLSQTITVLLLSVYFMFLLYLLMNFKLRFIREQAFIKGVQAFYRDNIRGINHFLLPILFSFLMFVALNIVTFFLLFIPGRNIFLVIFTVVLVLYLSWLRAYYLNIMEGSKKTKHASRRRRNH